MNCVALFAKRLFRSITFANKKSSIGCFSLSLLHIAYNFILLLLFMVSHELYTFSSIAVNSDSIVDESFVVHHSIDLAENR